MVFSSCLVKPARDYMSEPSFKKFPFGFPPAYPGRQASAEPTQSPYRDTTDQSYSNSNSYSEPDRGSFNSANVDDLARILNTALVATKSQEGRDFPAELYKVMESPAFRAILSAIRQHARSQGLSEKHAAEQIVRTFRKLDELWSSYVFQEGVERVGSGS